MVRTRRWPTFSRGLETVQTAGNGCRMRSTNQVAPAVRKHPGAWHRSRDFDAPGTVPTVGAVPSSSQSARSLQPEEESA
jgi:hypothetical protein